MEALVPVEVLLLAAQGQMAVQVVLLAALVAAYQLALQGHFRVAVVADLSLTKTSTTRLNLGPQAGVAAVVVIQVVRLSHRLVQAPALSYRTRLALRELQAVAALVPLAS